MIAVSLALLSAAGYGLSDFLGGFLSRRGSAWPVAVAGQLSAAVCTTVVALLTRGHPTGAHFAWAVLGGAGTAIGSGFLYRGLATGRMGLVAPVSAVGAAIVPVLVGLASGERLSWLTWLGFGAAVPGIWFVSVGPRDPASRRDGLRSGAGRSKAGRMRAAVPAGLGDGLAAGLGFGVLFVALGQIPRTGGLLPLALCQATSVPVLVVVAMALRVAWVPRDRASRLAVLTGPLGTVATGAFLLATQHGYLSVAGVLASLYPAVTVLLAVVVLRERIRLRQGIGLALCGASLACVAGG
jgi:drug/metabolite transporter (DMT)-like permease